MTNQELVELVSTIKERFEELMVDVRNAARIGAFDASAEQCGMSGLHAFQAFTRSLVESVERTQENGAKIIDGENSGWEEEATELLRERGYSLTKEEVVETKVENEETNEVEAKEVDATCPSFLNGEHSEQDEEPLVSVPSNGLCEKEVDAAKKTVRAFFCDAVGFMRNAVMAGAFTRDELDELAADVADSFSQAWQWREDEPWKKDKAMRNVRKDLERNA